jgi:hypothetical protein
MSLNNTIVPISEGINGTLVHNFNTMNLTIGELYQAYPDTVIMHQSDLYLVCAACVAAPIIGMLIGQLVKYLKNKRALSKKPE